ncbi:MAG: hypothetical protein KA436_09985 [Oligoflexales bacterium]|nr:hypothetical protein [Oligoflexales bacterium]
MSSFSKLLLKSTRLGFFLGFLTIQFATQAYAVQPGGGGEDPSGQAGGHSVGSSSRSWARRLLSAVTTAAVAALPTSVSVSLGLIPAPIDDVTAAPPADDTKKTDSQTITDPDPEIKTLQHLLAQERDANVELRRRIDRQKRSAQQHRADSGRASAACAAETEEALQTAQRAQECAQNRADAANRQRAEITGECARLSERLKSSERHGAELAGECARLRERLGTAERLGEALTESRRQALDECAKHRRLSALGASSRGGILRAQLAAATDQHARDVAIMERQDEWLAAGEGRLVMLCCELDDAERRILHAEEGQERSSIEASALQVLLGLVRRQLAAALSRVSSSCGAPHIIIQQPAAVCAESSGAGGRGGRAPVVPASSSLSTDSVLGLSALCASGRPLAVPRRVELALPTRAGTGPSSAAHSSHPGLVPTPIPARTAAQFHADAAAAAAVPAEVAEVAWRLAASDYRTHCVAAAGEFPVDDGQTLDLLDRQMSAGAESAGSCAVRAVVGAILTPAASPGEAAADEGDEGDAGDEGKEEDDA